MSLPLALQKIGDEYLLFGAAGLISLVAFVGLILVPALSAYGRIWEKAAAGLLSMVVLAALVLDRRHHRPGRSSTTTRDIVRHLRRLGPGPGRGVWIMSRCPRPPKARKPL